MRHTPIVQGTSAYCTCSWVTEPGLSRTDAEILANAHWLANVGNSTPYNWQNGKP